MEFILPGNKCKNKEQLSRCSGMTVLLLIFIYFYQKTSVLLLHGTLELQNFLIAYWPQFWYNTNSAVLKLPSFGVVDGAGRSERMSPKWSFWNWVMKKDLVGVCLLNCRYLFYSNFGITICCQIFLQTRFMTHGHTPLQKYLLKMIHERISDSCLFIFCHATLYF